MPRICTICSGTHRKEIDLALVNKKPFRRIASRFAVSEATVRRHVAHVPEKLAQAQHAADVVQADSLLARLLALSQETAAILKEARDGDEKDNELALKAIARAEKQIELQGKLLGALPPPTTVNVLISPQWLSLKATLVTCLMPFPEALGAVLAALEKGGNGYGSAPPHTANGAH